MFGSEFEEGHEGVRSDDSVNISVNHPPRTSLVYHSWHKNIWIKPGSKRKAKKTMGFSRPNRPMAIQWFWGTCMDLRHCSSQGITGY
jgi:hypothetical protein